MVKKVINIGVEGNDASGDPLREAFNKANENFNELYSAFGKGDGISITALSEGPDETPPNTILIMNDDPNNPKYLTKELVGEGGIQIVNTSSSVLTIKSIASALGSDTSPYLINNLDARGLNILNVAEPSQFVANQFNLPNTDSFAINKGYADTHYVNSDGDAMTGPLSVPAGAIGSQVPRANEVVLKSGGLSSKMTGPLILSDNINVSDLPLTAATKQYVDLSNYASTINLYVSTQGSDTLFDIDDNLKGRSFAYAFRTISAACRYAQTLIDASPLTVGITVKDITYANGDELSTFQQIISVDDYFILSITNDGSQTDPRDGADIRPGQLIKGKVSGAIVKIEEIQGLFSGYENYRVLYVTNPTDVPFVVGEPLEYGNPTQDLNITIFVETGNYYEHYPIRVPENVSIVGDELRRVLIRPRPGRSASWAADLYFRRDELFDVDLQVTDREFGYHYLTDTSSILFTGDAENPGGYVNASSILLQNKDYIINEIIGYLNTVEIDGTLNLFYDEDKCKRDTELIILALAYDMAYDSNFASIAAARAYYRGTQAATVLGNDKIATLDALDQLKIILVALVSGSISQQRISNNIDLMKTIINGGISNVPLIVWPNPTSITDSFANAKTLINNNKEFLKAEISAYITQQLNANRGNPSSIWFGLELDLEACRRDVQYIIEAVVYDLGYGGNWQTVDAAAAYFYNEFIININEKLPTLEAYLRLKERIQAIAVGGSFTNYQNIIPRVGGIPGGLDAGTYAADLIQIIRDTISNDGVLPLRIYPGTTSISTEILNNLNLMLSNNVSIQNQIISYLNSNYFIYDENLCRRDLGLVIDALGYDLVYGSYYKSLEAGNSYFESESALLVIQSPDLDPSDPFYNPDGQLAKTLAGFERLKFIVKRVVQENPPPVSYQNLYPSNIPLTTSTLNAEPGTDDIVEKLVDFMIKIITRDSSFNPPKQNNELDVFLMNNGTILRNISCQEHGGFMCVLDPVGQILTKSPYIQTASSFSRSINERIFAGGMLVDAFAGNLPANITTRVSETEILVDGLTIRPPNLPCAFYISGVRFQVDLITEWDQEAGTARVHINPLTPDDDIYPSEFIDNDSTRLFMPSTYIEFLSAGNNSMLCNDYTQLNDLGYGLAAINGGLLEAVSVFTYYNQISYFADTGGQIRSVGGSSAHGAYALVAKDAFPLEIPDDVYLLEDMVVGAEVYSPYDNYVNVSGTNLSGTGAGATFNIIVNETSYIITLNNPGSGYLNGNQIIFLGGDFGGISGINDVTITITGVSGSGISTFTYTGLIPEGAPINDYFNRAEDITIYVTNLTPTEFKISNGAELEVVFGNSPNRQQFRYLVNNAEDVTDSTDFPVTPTTNVYRLNLASGGLGSGSAGIKEALVNGTRVTLRQNQSLLIYDINRDTATRPSTALVFDEAPTFVNRVIAISNVNAKEGTFTWSPTPLPGTEVECTSVAHGLTPGDEIYIVFAAGSGTSGAPSRGFYTIQTTPNADDFTVIALVPTENFVEGTFTWGQANGECEVQLKEPFRSVVMNSYYNASDFSAQPYTVAVDRAFSTINEFNCISTSGINESDPIKFNGVIGGITAGTTYYVKSIISDTRFTISDTLGGSVKSLTSYAGGVLTATATTAGSNLITVASTSLLYVNKVIRFSGNVGGGLKPNTPYYVRGSFTGTQFQVSLTPGGSAVSLTTTTNSMTITLEAMYGSTDIDGSDFYTYGVTGSYKFAIRDLSTIDGERVMYNKDIGFTMLMGWRGKVHKVTNYITSEQNGTPFAIIEIDNLGVVDPEFPVPTYGLIEPVGYLEGGWDNAPNMKAALPADSPGNVTINISTVRATSHDMLDVGTGSYASTNFPNVIFGRADRDSDQAAEVREVGKGRCFFVTSDQDGNFKVGDFFKVDQGTGTVTFSSSIAISNLDGLGFKRGVAVAEFSVDDSFFDNATDTVPTEQAVRTYIDRRLGLTHNGAIINPASGRLIPSSLSGFMSLDGKLAMKAVMDMGSFRIKNVADPSLNQDATTKVYVDYFLRRQGGTSRVDVESFKMLSRTVFGSATVSGITGSGPWTAVLTLSSTTGIAEGYQFLATNGTGSIGTGVCVVTLVNSSLNQITFTSTGGTTPVAGTVTNVNFFAGALNMNDNKIINLATPTNDYDAVTKLYVDQVAAAQNELRELGGVSLPNPITGVTTNSMFVFNGTNFTWGAQAGDVLFTLAGNTFTSAIQPGVIINSDVNASAAIDQSKLNMTLATTRASAPTGTVAQKQAASGLASFDSASFNITDGFVTLKGNGLTLSMLPQMNPDTVVGNSGASTATPGEVTFATVVQEGGALYKTDSIWTQNGALVRTGAGTFSIVAYKSAYNESTATDKGTLVLRDVSDGGFSGSIINATTQFNIKGNRAFNQSGDATPFLEIRTPQDTIAINARSVASTVNGNTYGNWSTNGGTWTNTGTWSLTGPLTLGTASVTTSTINGTWTANGNWTIQNSTWVLSGTSTLESTYTADIAEYYQGDKEYDVGTVLMIGGEFDVTIAKGQGTTKVAGVVSNNAAFMMYKECPGIKNLIALQGRVPCKVIGKIEKGDTLVVGIVPGVAMSSSDPKAGSIIGKALQNYDSDHVGTIEVMVGKH